jgi:hypothetical protein
MHARMARRAAITALGIKMIVSESQWLATNPGKCVGDASPQRNMFVSFGVAPDLLIFVHRQQ